MTPEEFSRTLKEVEKLRNISGDLLIGAIQSGISLAAQKKIGLPNLQATFDAATCTFGLSQVKVVREEPTDTAREISLSDARAIAPEARVGDTVGIRFPYDDLGRIAAMSTRQMMQKTLAEIEAAHRHLQLLEQQWKLAIATVRGKTEDGDYLCEVGDLPAEMPRQEQAFRERFTPGEVIKTVVVAVAQRRSGSVYIVSRTHPLLLRYLLIREVPEIKDGIVEIKSLARDTAGRSKVAVYSANPDIDAAGACIGPEGARVRQITKELKGENIDIIEWSEDPATFIAAALTPAKVRSVSCNPKTNDAVVRLDPEQHSIAVGKKGLNIRLASRVTRWNITLTHS